MIVEIINNVLYVLQFIIVATLCFRMKQRLTIQRVSLVVLGLMIFTVLLNSLPSAMFQMPITMLYVLFSMCMLYVEKRIFLTMYTLAMMATFSMLNMMVEMMMLSVFCMIENKVVHDINNIYTLIVSIMVLLPLGVMVRRGSNKGVRTLGWRYLIFFSLLLIVDSIVVLALGDLALTSYVDSNFYHILYIVVVIGIFLQIAMVIWFMLSREIYREKEMIVQKYLENQTEHYRYLENREQETKKFRHDIRSHMQMLNLLYQQQNHEEFDQYINEINGRIEEFGNRICVNNGIVDAILNRYYDDAKMKGIQLKVEGYFPKKCRVSAYDLCTIFSNLLSNAIRAVEECDGKEIKVSCRYNETEILIAVENAYKQIEKDRNGRLQTSKTDAVDHGLGLKNVEECVVRNRGYMDIQMDSSCFRVLLSLSNVQGECT